MPTGVYIRTQKCRERLATGMLGNKNGVGSVRSDSFKKHLSDIHKGVKKSVATRIKMSEHQRGEKGCNWKGGKEPINKIIRKSIEYRLWREAVFARDNWTCQKSKVKGGKLHPHHILNFSQHPELRFAIDNGVTLNETSHREFHKKYGEINNTVEQLNEFLKNG